MIEKDEDTTSTLATEELYRTNILRLQASELLTESILHLSSNTGQLDKEVKWAHKVWEYIDIVKTTVAELKPFTLSPNDVVFTNKDKKQNDQHDEKRFWIQLHSDKAHKHLNSQSLDKDQWNFSFPGGSCLKVNPINSYASNGAGLTNTTANAHVIPTIDLAVLMPTKDLDEDNTDSEGMIEGKDYLNGRYFDKRNILAIHIAKQLSQKKHRKKIGSIHISNHLDGDYRKVSLILTPPFNEDSEKNVDTDAKKSKERKKGKDQDVKSQKKKKNKIRFRVRLVLGAQVHKDPSTANFSWIPSARLFPNRCNNKFLPSSSELDSVPTSNLPSPSYNNSLATDLQHLSTTQILSSTALSASKSFTESWTLIKIWCLQRGFLRGHDTFSEKCIGLTLAYLFRSKLVSNRMDCIQIFTIWMKFMSDVDWLGDNQEKSEEQDNAIGKDTIRHSSSSAYRTLDVSGVEKRKSRSAIVMPNHLSTEKQTMINCVQNRLYASDYKNQIASKQVDTYVPNTLLDCYKIYSDGPIFLDPTMTVNYFAHLSTSFIHELRSEALKALSCIHAHNNGNISENITSGRKSPFHQLFLENQRFWTRYDTYVRINIRDVLLPFESANSRGKVQLWGHDVHDVGRYESISRGLLKVLQLALGDRVNVIRVLTTGNGSVTGKTLQQVVDDTGGDIGRMSFTETDETLFLPILNSSDQKFQGYAQNSTILPVFNNASDSDIVLGLRINTDNCSRIVDRGPPADDTKATETFVTLWGEKKAQLRRFKDGAIVHAVVWNEVEQYRDDEVFDYDGAEKVGSIVEKIIRLIANIHFLKSSSNSLSKVRFELRDLISLVEGSTQTTTGGLTNRFMNSATILQKDIMSAFDDLSKFFKENSYADDSKLGLPLAIDSVEALSPSLRYSELFPSAPHSFLGGDSKLSKSKKVSSVLIGEPVLVQIRFESSSKWPTDISAMGAAKCAMLIQLAESIEKMKESGDSLVAKFDGPISVTPSYLDLGYRGYCWRIIVRADQEIKMLYSLRNPSPEAISLRESLTRRHVVSASHHFIIHGVHSKHPAASYVVRLAERWIGTHMLSGLFPHEAVELIVASVFTDPAPFDKPSTISCGFLRFLHLLAFHDWERFPLIVDPESHFSNEDRVHIFSEFEATRGDAYLNGPAMYIISPVDKIKSSTDTATSFKPAFTLVHPEKVVLKRASALASRSYDFLMNHILDINDNRIYSKDKWTSIFKEDPQSLLSYSCLLRVNRDFVVDSECSSTNADMIVSTKKEILTPYTRSMISRTEGPKLLQKSAYKNLMSSDSITCNFNPIDVVVDQLRSQLGHLAVFFYNAHSPDVIAALWRPSIFSGQPFTAMNSEFKRPIDIEWDNDSLVVTNITDIVGLLKFITRNVTIDIKVLNGGGYDDTESNHSHKGKRKNSMR